VGSVIYIITQLAGKIPLIVPLPLGLLYAIDPTYIKGSRKQLLNHPYLEPSGQIT